MSKDSNDNDRTIDISRTIELWEYNFFGHKSYFDPNHNIIFGGNGLALYKEEFGERLRSIPKAVKQDETILRQSTSLLPRESDLSRQLFQRRLRNKNRK